MKYHLRYLTPVLLVACAWQVRRLSGRPRGGTSAESSCKTPGPNVIKPFYFRTLQMFVNKLECLSMASLSSHRMEHLKGALISGMCYKHITILNEASRARHTAIWSITPGNTKGGSIIVPLTSRLTGLD